MKKKSTTQKNHIIFYLANKEKQFSLWRSKTWQQTKICFDAVFGIFDFYVTKFNKYVGDGLKNPLVKEQNKRIFHLNNICKCMRLKHIILTQRNKRSKFSPNAHKDISFNQNLVSKFGTSQE